MGDTSIEPRRRGAQPGERNRFWRGGRSVASNGYVLIRVGVDHPLADVARGGVDVSALPPIAEWGAADVTAWPVVLALIAEVRAARKAAAQRSDEINDACDDRGPREWRS